VAIGLQLPAAKKPFIILSAFCDGDYENIQNLIFGNDKEQSIFEKANGGTIVFENLYTMPLTIQSKILDSLQKECITRVSKVIKFDVRVIGVFELEPRIDVIDFVKRKLLNEMLFHRLNVKNLTIPPLRARIDDIPQLFSLAIKMHVDKHLNLDISSLKHALTSYVWPCNTQELCNAAEYLVIMGKIHNTESITINMLHPNILGVLKTDFASFANISAYLDKDYKNAKKHFDIEYIKAQLRRFSNNVAKTARFMGVDRAALYRKIRSLLGVQQSGEKKIVHLINRDFDHKKQDEDAVI
jgi:two-component system nitrogen regulation response regulator NtrX